MRVQSSHLIFKCCLHTLSVAHCAINLRRKLMKFQTVVMLGVGVALMAAISVSQAADADKKVTTVKCVVVGKEVKIADAKVVSHNGGNVYVCCGNCKAKFEKNAAAYAAKANHQLVLTGQAKQVKCPLAGRPVNAKQVVEIAGVKVGLCCGNCKAKLAGAKGDDQVKMAFSDAAFKKGFAVNKK